MQTIYLDISNKGVIPTIQAKQGEVGRKFVAFIFDSGIPYSIPVDAVVSVWYDGESGKGNYTDVGETPAVVVENNKITVELIAQMLSVEGCGIITILINSADGKQIGLWNIPYCAESVAGFESEKAEEYYTAFSKAASELAEASKVFTPDKTLTKSGSPADAMETGLQISVERSRIDELVAMRNGADSDLYYEHDGSGVDFTIKSNGANAVVSGRVAYITINVGNSVVKFATIPNVYAPLGGTAVLHTCDDYEFSIMVDETEPYDTAFYIHNKTDGVLNIPEVYFTGQYPVANVYINELADVRVGADGTVYETAGEAVREQIRALQNGSGGGGTAEGAVLYTAQTLTEEQKAQARENIGAAAVGEGGNGVGIDDTVVSKNSTWSSEKIASEVANASGGTAADVTQFYRIFPAMDYKITFVVDASNNVTITLPSILYIEKATAYATRINVDASANTFTLASTRMLCYSISGGTFAVYTEGQYAAAKTDLVPCAFNHYGRIKGQWEMYADYLSKADFRTDYNIKLSPVLMGYEEEGYSATGFQRYIDFAFDDVANKYTMTIPKGTAFVYGNEGKKLYTVATETSINLGTVSQDDKLVWFNTSTNAFRVTASTSMPQAAEILLCAVKLNTGYFGCISVSILAPYTINGCLPGMESVYNTIDNVKYLLDFVYGDIRNATDTLHYAQIKRMAMKAPKCLPYDITVMRSNVYQYLYTYDDANGTNGKSYGIINKTGNYTIKAGTYFRLTAHLITNETVVLGDRYNNPVFNAIRIYRTDMLKEKFDVAFTPYERYMNTNIRAINHRGLNRVAPENTLPAYIEARKAGFEYAETDVAFTADGHAVLLHDTTVDRTSDGTGNIADLTLEQVRAMDFGSWFSPAYAGTQIPTFEEFISMCRKIGLKPYVELRDMTTEQAQSLVTIVKKYGMQKNTTWICTSTVTLSAISEAYPAARLGLVCSGLTEANVASAVALRNEVNDVFIDTDDTSDNAVALMMAADIEGEVWTVWTEAAINGLNPYFTGVTSDNLVAGSVLYKSTMGEYE